MKLSASLSILLDLRFAIQTAFIPTIRAVIHSPSLLLQPSALSRVFMAKLWILFGKGVDENNREIKRHLITPNAYGVVLDIGAGHGHTVNYLDKSRVTKYIALEPNALMHSELRSVANTAGFTESDGTLLILPCGAEDTGLIISAVNGQYSVDTLISILTLCSVPSPKQTLSAIIGQVLKPGGQILFQEHVLSPRPDIAWWQRFWAPIWSIFFDGCRLDCPTDLWLDKMVDGDGASMWGQKSVWGNAGQPEETLFYNRVGKMVKHLF